ncbi:uncharacterized protein LOC108458501 isoform X4 [Gossypium arboreum]|uniref:uncharacterized protein LOC108458501 isoform X4 n=1 Tax=Gossypium arboreum TaxID=29729 RepID=UPI0022F1D449|nr:uncharacterized protein LOC108458501 isoform X4 [Gossypium arboreum]XP_017613410.2 uncharacterized protein LOC108458501 isoform X4 [Gossypium arboreum]
METEKGKLVAQQEGLVKKTRIMVGIDESDESFHGLQWTLDNLFGCITATAAPEQPEANDKAGSRLITLSLVHVQQAFHLQYVPAGPGGTAYVAAGSRRSIRFGTPSYTKSEF